MRRTRCIVALAALVALAAPPAGAGVTVESRMDVTLLGGSGQGTGTVLVQGGARRETRTLTLSASGADEPGPAQRSDAITRLDRGVQWQLDAADSTYRAVPLTQLGVAAEAGGMPLPGLAPGAAGSVTWTVEVAPRPETAIVAGYTARRTDITLTGTSHAEDAGPLGTIRLVTQWWMATGVPGAAELSAFDRGFERSTGGIGADVPGLLAGLPGAAEAITRLTAAQRGLAGVPLRTVLQVEAPGVASLLGSMGGGAGPGDGDAAPQPLVTSTIEVTSIRVGKVPAARFALPQGWRAAPPAEAPAPEVPE